MQLRIPLVISPEPALLEVTDGHAVVMSGSGPDALADAVRKACESSATDLDVAAARAADVTWARSARELRAFADDLISARRAPR